MCPVALSGFHSRVFVEFEVSTMTKILAFWRVSMTSLQCFILFLCLSSTIKSSHRAPQNQSSDSVHHVFHEIKSDIVTVSIPPIWHVKYHSYGIFQFMYFNAILIVNNNGKRILLFSRALGYTAQEMKQDALV